MPFVFIYTSLLIDKATKLSCKVYGISRFFFYFNIIARSLNLIRSILPPNV